MEKMEITLIEPQKDLPPGDTFRCSDCGTRLRTGQPHSAVEPWPHQTLAALIVSAWLPKEV